MVPALKVKLRDANFAKEMLQRHNLFNYAYRPLKTPSEIIFPITNKKDVDKFLKKTIKYEYIDENLPRAKKTTSLKEALRDVLTQEELAHLKTSFDVIGSIAVLEIDEVLKPKEKIIANTLLNINKSIKTVLKKGGEHEGEFRTQKMIYLAGKKTKETIHKENNIVLKLDVEKVYFSPRLSTERKRISNLIKTEEEVLVMFSGCAPYPCVIAKNTSARDVYGVEINPIGHKYGLENVKLNKLHNVTLIRGDVKDVVPNFFKYIIGLKSSINKKQLKKRLEQAPNILELHLNGPELFEKIKQLKQTIEELQSRGIEVVVHMPLRYKNIKYSLAKNNINDELKMLRQLGRLCKEYHIKAIIHATQEMGIKEDAKRVIEHIKLLKLYLDYFYFENVLHGVFAKTEDIIMIGKKAGIKNMCIDIAHAFIVYKDNKKLERHIKNIKREFNTYFHLNDHDFKTHSCEIGKGYVDFSKVLPYVNKGVIEVVDKNENIAREMTNSFNKIKKMNKKFDRIIMPLPKTAEDFLEIALSASKKGTKIHFYDFQHELEFKKAHEKIERACKKAKKKYKILNTVKCGQHSPRTYRICVDFEILE